MLDFECNPFEKDNASKSLFIDIYFCAPYITLFVFVSNLNERGLTNRYKQCMHNKSDSTQIKQKNRIKPKRKDNCSDGINLYGYFGVTKQMFSTLYYFCCCCCCRQKYIPILSNRIIFIVVFTPFLRDCWHMNIMRRKVTCFVFS